MRIAISATGPVLDAEVDPHKLGAFVAALKD